MSIIETSNNETAQGAVREIYDDVLTRIPFIPKPVQVMSASPELMAPYWEMMKVLLDHSRIPKPVFAYLRLGVAMTSEYPYCVELNTQALKMQMDLSQEQIVAFRNDPSRADLPEKDRELVHFVVRSVREPEEITAQDTQRLRDLGWSDSDILDATFMGAFMLTSGVLFSTFKMNED